MNKINVSLTVFCFSVLLNGCAQTLILPTDQKGLYCVSLVNDIKNACYAERKIEVEDCEKRNEKRRELSKKDQELMNEEIKKSSANEDKKMLARILMSLKGGIQIENCNKYTTHCDDEYKNLFINKCGGRIE